MRRTILLTMAFATTATLVSLWLLLPEHRGPYAESDRTDAKADAEPTDASHEARNGDEIIPFSEGWIELDLSDFSPVGPPEVREFVPAPERWPDAVLDELERYSPIPSSPLVTHVPLR